VEVASDVRLHYPAMPDMYKAWWSSGVCGGVQTERGEGMREEKDTEKKA
jgi:hypothetical protein